jgi:hypothetical protein
LYKGFGGFAKSGFCGVPRLRHEPGGRLRSINIAEYGC